MDDHEQKRLETRIEDLEYELRELRFSFSALVKLLIQKNNLDKVRLNELYQLKRGEWGGEDW